MANPAPPISSSHPSRDHSQVPSSLPLPGSTISALEFAETTTVSLEWRISGLRAMYESSKGDSKSKCTKSAVFGDPDNLWEVLWYPNSGVQGGEYASLYLSCVPTCQEREQGIGNKWTRKGLWWFRFEVKVPEERTGKFVVLASKDASDHTFAVKTANWGWQQFAKRDQLFLHPAVLGSDTFMIVCTISAQPQPPAGYWLGVGTGSGFGAAALTSWAGGDGASGGVAGGTFAAGGPKRTVPHDLVSAVGEMLDDPLYSDVEFVVPAPCHAPSGDRPPPRRIYANKKLLNRCEYFDAMFHSGFGEFDGTLDDDDDPDEALEALSDSDNEDEAENVLDTPISAVTELSRAGSTHTTTRDVSPSNNAPASSTDGSVKAASHRGADDVDLNSDDSGESTGGTAQSWSDPSPSASGTALPGDAGDVSMGELDKPVSRARTRSVGQAVLGPKKTRVVIRDAAWSTWWAILYWLYTDTIYFAPLRSSFDTRSRHSRSSSVTGAQSVEPRSRREWTTQWLTERGMGNGSGETAFGLTTAGLGSQESATSPAVGPRPVSAKSVYRLADKLDLPALKLRAFQHICSQLTPHNIPAEVFSRFSSLYEDVRKVQIAFFLKHWSEIKKSDTMQNIWGQIRLGKHVGFEDVWPLIMTQLEFKSSP